MKIYSVTPYNLQFRNINTQTKKQNYIPVYSNAYGKLPTTEQYLAFTGGYSLDLGRTIKELDKLAEKNSSVYPPNIREWAGMILEEGNKAKDTLISIHKKYFAGLNECCSLNEAKSRFTEFKDVIPAGNVNAMAGSFIDRFNKGELEFFDNEEDLSLQLLKLYWGEGFSLNDLKKYTGNLDLYYTMKKLNIPLADKNYGHILKFSDPEYNERLTREMTEKRLAALDRKAQEKDGEPVYIKRGPLSAEHKQKISEGLKRYYQENPERIYDMSERQKEFYRQNPERAEELTRVLKKAWNIAGADRIKNALSSFMKSKGIESFNPESNPADMSKEQSKLMKQFWTNNEWAKKSFSRNMQYAWKKIKEENETFFIVRSVPVKLKEYLEKTLGIKPGTLDLDTKYNPYLHTSSIDENSEEIIKKSLKNINGIENVMADTYQIAVLNVVTALKDIRQSRKNKPFNELLDLAVYIAKSNIREDGKSYKIQYTEDAQQDFLQLALYAAQSKCEELVNIVNKALEDAFDFSLIVHKDVILK